MARWGTGILPRSLKPSGISASSALSTVASFVPSFRWSVGRGLVVGRRRFAFAGLRGFSFVVLSWVMSCAWMEGGLRGRFGRRGGWVCTLAEIIWVVG